MNAKVIFGSLGGVLALAVGSWVFGGTSAVRSSLESDGYTDLTVTQRGLFNFGFEGNRGDQHCVGGIERVPMSMNRQQMCMTDTPKEAAKEPRHEVLASNLTKLFKQFPIESLKCDPLDDDDSTLEHCHAECEGSTLDLTLKKVDGQWKMVLPDRVYYRPTLAQELTDAVTKKLGKVTEVSCGKGLLGFQNGDEFTCEGTRTDPPTKKAKKATQKQGQVKVTFGEAGAYSWSATF